MGGTIPNMAAMQQLYAMQAAEVLMQAGEMPMGAGPMGLLEMAYLSSLAQQQAYQLQMQALLQHMLNGGQGQFPFPFHNMFGNEQTAWGGAGNTENAQGFNNTQRETGNFNQATIQGNCNYQTEVGNFNRQTTVGSRNTEQEWGEGNTQEQEGNGNQANAAGRWNSQKQIGSGDFAKTRGRDNIQIERGHRDYQDSDGVDNRQGIVGNDDEQHVTGNHNDQVARGHGDEQTTVGNHNHNEVNGNDSSCDITGNHNSAVINRNHEHVAIYGNGIHVRENADGTYTKYRDDGGPVHEFHSKKTGQRFFSDRPIVGTRLLPDGREVPIYGSPRPRQQAPVCHRDNPPPPQIDTLPDRRFRTLDDTSSTMVLC